MKHIKRLFSSTQSESGQVVVITVLALGFFGLMGALSLDVGIYVNDRRDAQNVVDKAALAGALELTLATANTGSAAATAKANEWATNNGIDLSDPNITLTVSVVNTCYSLNDPYPTGVEVSVQREASSVFLGFVPGVTDWDVNATALACAGRPVSAYGFIPFAISELSACYEPDGNGGYQPRLGHRCVIQSDQSSSGSNGQLGFPAGATSCAGGNSSAAVLRDYVDEGVAVTCSIGDQVSANQGNNVGAVRQGLASRLSLQGACEDAYAAQGGTNVSLTTATTALNTQVASEIPPSVPLGGTITTANNRDDLYEIWAYHGDPSRHPAEGLSAFDCEPAVSGNQTSPRNVQLIVVRDWANPDGAINNSYIVRGFARAFVEGCEASGTFYPNCDQGGGPFTIYVRFVEQFAESSVNLGIQASAGDIGVFLRR